MKLKNYNVYFFFTILIGVSVLAFFVVKNFIIPFMVAVILATLFSFVYRWFLKIFGDRRGLSSALSCLVIALIIIIPSIMIISLMVGEIQGIVETYSNGSNENVARTASNTLEKVNSLPVMRKVGLDKFINEDALISAMKSLSENAIGILGATYRSVTHFVFVTFIMFFSLFYLFFDGEKLARKIFAISPLRDEYEDKLLVRFKSIIRATIKGTTLIAIIQGLLGGILFWAAGVSSPVLLGILMTVSSVIPSIGSGLVWAPVGIIMLLMGNFTAGLSILIFGALVISTIDNLLRPRLVGRDTEMHPLMILFSTLGGIALFGITGFIVGPIVISLFVALWDIYALEFKQQLEGYNK